MFWYCFDFFEKHDLKICFFLIKSDFNKIDVINLFYMFYKQT